MVEAIYLHKAHINRVKPAKNMDNLVKNNNVLIKKERKSKLHTLFICLKYSIHEIFQTIFFPIKSLIVSISINSS